MTITWSNRNWVKSVGLKVIQPFRKEGNIWLSEYVEDQRRFTEVNAFKYGAGRNRKLTQLAYGRRISANLAGIKENIRMGALLT